MFPTIFIIGDMPRKRSMRIRRCRCCVIFMLRILFKGVRTGFWRSAPFKPVCFLNSFPYLFLKPDVRNLLSSICSPGLADSGLRFRIRVGVACILPNGMSRRRRHISRISGRCLLGILHVLLPRRSYRTVLMCYAPGFHASRSASPGGRKDLRIPVGRFSLIYARYWMKNVLQWCSWKMSSI